MAKIKLNGTQLEYIEKGKGDPVVLVHGTLGDYRSWTLQMDVFAEKYRVISYSRRYHYPNRCTGDETDYSATLHADDLAAFIAGLGFESAHIVGTSYGSYTSLFLAARHPERVRSMVLGDPPVLPLLTHNTEQRELRHNFLKRVWQPAGKALRQDKMEEGIRIFVDGVVEEGAFDSFPEQIRNQIMENACEFSVETSSADFWTRFSCDDAEKITTPILLLTGDRSLRMLQVIVEELACCLPNNEFIVVPDTSHELPADNPEKYNEIVLNFLAKYPA